MLVGPHQQPPSPLVGIAWILGVLIVVVPRLLLPVYPIPVQPSVAEFGLTALKLSVVHHTLSQRYRIITLAEYDQLTPGMHLLDVEHHIGTGQEIRRQPVQGDVVTTTYEWQNPDGSRLIATFQDMKLTGNAQAGLK